jgi:hypothetical protein
VRGSLATLQHTLTIFHVRALRSLGQEERAKRRYGAVTALLYALNREIAFVQGTLMGLADSGFSFSQVSRSVPRKRRGGGGTGWWWCGGSEGGGSGVTHGMPRPVRCGRCYSDRPRHPTGFLEQRF